MLWPFTSGQRTLFFSQLDSPRPVRFNLLVRWHAVRLFVRWHFPLYPVISLALNSISTSTREEGRLSTGTRCLLCCGDRVIELKWFTTCKYMYVAHVLRVATSMCGDFVWNYFKNHCSSFSEHILIKTRCMCAAAAAAQIIMWWWHYDTDAQGLSPRRASMVVVTSQQMGIIVIHNCTQLPHSHLTTPIQWTQTRAHQQKIEQIRKLLRDVFWTYPWHDASIKTGQLSVVVRYFLLYHPAKRTKLRFSKPSHTKALSG